MTVAELIAELQKMPSDARVFRYTDWPVEEVNLAHSTPHSDDQEPDHVPTVVLY